MRLAIMQPYVFPYIGYYQLINLVDKFVIYDDVGYINRGWINRNNVLVNQAKYLFTIPIKEASQNKIIRDVELANAEWKPKFIKTLELAYKKAPYFINVFPIIIEVILSEETKISKIACRSLQSVFNYLDLAPEFVLTSAIYNNTDLKAQQRILDICIQENAREYVNPIGGAEIYSGELFSDLGIQLHFLKTGNISYQQFNNDFIPNLSIIDVLMFNSKEAVMKMLNLFELV